MSDLSSRRRPVEPVRVAPGQWSADGRTLHFLGDDGVLVSVEISLEGGAPRATSPRVVLRPAGGLEWLGLFPDGSRRDPMSNDHTRQAWVEPLLPGFTSLEQTDG